MSGLESIILGIVQGLTEFIPVSSSGHLVIVQNLFGLDPSHLYLEFINIGTLFALLIYFRHRIVAIATDMYVNKNFILARNILLTAIPAGLTGLILAGFIDNEPFFASTTTVMLSLAIVGIFMVILPNLPKASSIDKIEELSWLRALLIGFAQMLALIPGVSRSGSTIVAGRLSGMKPDLAAEYSFLAAIPIMSALAMKNFVKSSDRTYLMDNLFLLVVGNLLAFTVGILAIGFLMAYLKRHDLAIFGWYRILVAAVLAAFILL